MKTSEAGIQALTALESIRYHVYRDPGAGAKTIGIGHLLTRSELMSGKIRIGETVEWGAGLTAEQARALLHQDLAAAERAVSELVTVPLAQHQFDALVSFVFNIGTPAFRDSTLLRKLNAGDAAAVPAELRRWIYDDGIVQPVLQRRREDEVHLWEGALT